MKFGHNLPRNQVPEWSAFYMDYRGLKKLIKSFAEAYEKDELVDLAEFFFDLDRNLEDVDSFYNKKLAEAFRRLSLLQDRYGRPVDAVSSLDKHEIEEVMGALLELRTLLRNLQWFGEINRRGFVKITKKLDKHVSNAGSQERYIKTKVDPKPFARDAHITRLLVEINKWLSSVSEAKSRPPDDNRSENSVRSLGRSSNKAFLKLSQSTLDALDQAVRANDAEQLESLLSSVGILNDFTANSVLLNLLQISVTARSRSCIEFLLKHTKSLEEEDINERNCIHRFILSTIRTKGPNSDEIPGASSLYSQHYLQLTHAKSANKKHNPGEDTEPKTVTHEDEAVQLLEFVLDLLDPTQRCSLRAKDSTGRTPLHYAAKHGYAVLCDVMVKRMLDWGFLDETSSLEMPCWQDVDGHTPLHLSVIGGYLATTRALLQGVVPSAPVVGEAQTENGSDGPKNPGLGPVLILAVRSGFKIIAQILIDIGADLTWQGRNGESALHIAAHNGDVECAKVLLDHQNLPEGVILVDIQATESMYAWTPLHVASLNGHLEVVKLLIDHGADVTKADSSGWTAQEHAALRGHIAIAEFLGNYAKERGLTPPASKSSPTGTSTPNTDAYSSVEGRGSGGSGGFGRYMLDPIKSFGHRYLKNESMILVSLGSMDMRKEVDVVKLHNVPLTEAHTTEIDTALSIVVTAQGAIGGESTIIDLPVHENISTDPISFTTTDASKVKLLFDLVPTYSGSQKKIGRGVALLSSVKPTIGNQRMNLQGDVCVPIVSANLDVIGEVNFNFQIITPFSHPNMEVNSQQTYWKKVTETMLIGHRGLGKNDKSSRSLQLGENTIPSFIAAANLGAQYVEFDVQLTKDHVPVIYHDFLVSETGIDAPVHTLTLEQFLHINPNASQKAKMAGGLSSGMGTSDVEHKLDVLENGNGHSAGRSRSNSMHAPRRSRTLGFVGDGRMQQMEERMKHTLDYKNKGYKGNSRGNFIQAPFATLEDLFRELPEHVGFNIEMKYPMLHESEEQQMDTYAVELNSFCDTVLTKVYEMAGNRNIIFSSFSPDICLCLSFKQPSIPILFLTDAGMCPVGDIRASSLQEAIRFARRWNLLGVVSSAEPLVNSPRLIRVVKESGLVCVSYGTLNNDPLMVQKQVKEGIDAVIADSVLAIRKGLTAGQEVQSEAFTPPETVL